jgi:hypothetical protein
MATPVTVTRIQNRRGTQDQFDALYPVGYHGIGGFGDTLWQTSPPVLIFDVVGTGTVVTFTVSSALVVPPYDTLLVVGSTIVVTGVDPAIYNDTYTVSGIDTTTTPGLTFISCLSPNTGAFNPYGVASFIMPYNLANYPGVLMPGEIALCTDSRRMFTGNLNGEYVEIAIADIMGLKLLPLTLSLPPVGIPTVIPELTYLPTNFFSLLYDLTDAPPDLPPPLTLAGAVGPTFARNGEIKITAVVSPMNPVPPVPPYPFPPVTPVNLVDVSNEINLTPAYDISFSARYDNPLAPTHIQIMYQHNFPVDLVFSTSTIQWV